MLDFTIRNWDERRSGLSIGLCPGKYVGKESRSGSIFISESSFACMESTIKECSAPLSKNYSHWGVTEIPRSEWVEIISRLERLRSGVLAASSYAEALPLLPRLNFIEEAFTEDFETSKIGLSTLISNLNRWADKTLLQHDSISVLGV